MGGGDGTAMNPPCEIRQAGTAHSSPLPAQSGCGCGCGHSPPPLPAAPRGQKTRLPCCSPGRLPVGGAVFPNHLLVRGQQLQAVHAEAHASHAGGGAGDAAAAAGNSGGQGWSRRRRRAKTDTGRLPASETLQQEQPVSEPGGRGAEAPPAGAAGPSAGRGSGFPSHPWPALSPATAAAS